MCACVRVPAAPTLVGKYMGKEAGPPPPAASVRADLPPPTVPSAPVAPRVGQSAPCRLVGHQGKIGGAPVAVEARPVSRAMRTGQGRPRGHPRHPCAPMCTHKVPRTQCPLCRPHPAGVQVVYLHVRRGEPPLEARTRPSIQGGHVDLCVPHYQGARELRAPPLQQQLVSRRYRHRSAHVSRRIRSRANRRRSAHSASPGRPSVVITHGRTLTGR